jgi:5-methylcytosine-specific restriction endonuclease McrA
MPMDRSKYPSDWDTIARSIKNRAEWTCQECGRPCRKPGVSWPDFVEFIMEHHHQWYEDTSEEHICDDSGEHGHVEKPQRFTLTVAHLNHTPMDCRQSNLKALCAPCHLAYDRPHHAKVHTGTPYRRREKHGQLRLEV